MPVREELNAQLGELALRQRRAVVRPLTLGKERLAARAERLPKPEALLAAYTQRLDEQGECLRRGLADRVAIARGALSRIQRGSPRRCSRARLDRAKQRLAAARLVPALIERRIAEGRERAGVLWRMAEQLSPEKVLQRGYAIVRDGSGAPVMSAEAARASVALELQFQDGRLAVGGAGTTSPPPQPSSRTARRAARAR